MLSRKNQMIVKGCVVVAAVAVFAAAGIYSLNCLLNVPEIQPGKGMVVDTIHAMNTVQLTQDEESATNVLAQGTENTATIARDVAVADLNMDLDSWMKNLLANAPVGDFNQNAFALAAEQTKEVPEPSMALLIVGAFAMFSRCGRRHRHVAAR